MKVSNTDLTRTFQVIMILTGLVILLQGMIFAKAIVVPFMMSIIIAISCAGPNRWLQAKGFPGWLSATLLLGSLFVVFFASAFIVENSIQDFENNIPEYTEKFSKIEHQIADSARSRGVYLDGKGLPKIVSPESIMNHVGSFFHELVSLLSNGFLILMTVFFILGDSRGFVAKIAQIPGDKEVLMAGLIKFRDSAQEYMLIQILLSLLTGALVAGALLLVGLDYAFMWGLLAFMLNFIPTVGSIIAAVPAILLAMVQLGPVGALLVTICYLVINIAVGNFLTPRLVGEKLGLSTLVVFLSLVFWGWALGPIGMLMSVILTMKVKIALSSHEKTRWMATLLEPSPEEPNGSLPP